MLLLMYEQDKDSRVNFSKVWPVGYMREKWAHFSHIKHCTNKNKKRQNKQIKDRLMSLDFCGCVSFLFWNIVDKELFFLLANINLYMYCPCISYLHLQMMYCIHGMYFLMKKYNLKFFCSLLAWFKRPTVSNKQDSQGPWPPSTQSLKNKTKLCKLHKQENRTENQRAQLK